MIEGIGYKILEHVDSKKTGYQGTIYQRVDSGEIVVAHRGTEQIWKDGVITDGSMVLSRINPQANEAIELTRRAVALAREEGLKPGSATPEVTVTGHSLGGTLAQITAHHFDLRGETFNAYGAVSLDRRIPEGGDKVLNHVMAADTVSAASPHYGRVKVYATDKEVATLQASGYHNNRLLDAVTPDSPILAAGASLGSHSMHHFLPVDGKGARDRSVLEDPRATVLAEENRRTIAGYRDDVEDLRRGVTAISRGPIGAIRDGVDYLRGPLPAGEPATRQLREPQETTPRATPSSLPVSGRYDLGHGVSWGEIENPAAPVRPPLRADPPSPSLEVDRLLKAARTGDPAALRSAQEDLQASDFGQAWRALVQERQRDIARQVPEPGAVLRETATPSASHMVR